jgi:hypothetical protein
MQMQRKVEATAMRTRDLRGSLGSFIRYSARRALDEALRRLLGGGVSPNNGRAKVLWGGEGMDNLHCR